LSGDVSCLAKLIFIGACSATDYISHCAKNVFKDIGTQNCLANNDAFVFHDFPPCRVGVVDLIM